MCSVVGEASFEFHTDVGDAPGSVDAASGEVSELGLRGERRA
jgi:hypothetical protein